METDNEARNNYTHLSNFSQVHCGPTKAFI